MYNEANSRFTEDTRIEEIIRNVKHIKLSTSQAKKAQHKYHPEMVIDLDSSDEVAKPDTDSQKEAEMIEFENSVRNMATDASGNDNESFKAVKFS